MEGNDATNLSLSLFCTRLLSDLCPPPPEAGLVQLTVFFHTAVCLTIVTRHNTNIKATNTQQIKKGRLNKSRLQGSSSTLGHAHLANLRLTCVHSCPWSRAISHGLGLGSGTTESREPTNLHTDPRNGFKNDKAL